MHKSWSVVVLVLLLWLPGTGSTPNGRNTAQSIMIHVDEAQIPWCESTIEMELVRILGRSSDLRVVSVASTGSTLPLIPKDLYDVDSLTDWCQEAGCRYLVVIDVEREYLERRKNFHLPLVFHKYQTVGVIEAEVRLLDVKQRRFLLAEPVVVEGSGPRVFQATMDDDINDPDLHLTAPKKVRFIRHLEKQFCHRLVERMAQKIRIRTD